MLGQKFFRLLPYLLSGPVFLAAAVSLQGQSSVAWTTNFYAVTGTNFREIRASMAKARPWNDPFDGDTRWEVTWKFTAVQSPGGCSCSSFSTAIAITTTLPRWTPPAGVLPQVKEQWTRYFTNLAQHETGHARLGLAAAAEIQRRIAAVGIQPGCAQLKQLINERANQAIADYRRREREYDERTDHGRRNIDSR
jgi:predicted secreted Zn-dependent protease